MRRSNVILLGVLGTAAVAAAGCATTAERRARTQGFEAARTEIAEGRACLWEIGRLPPGAPRDPQTGLQRFSYTCEVNKLTFAAQEAHNDEVRRAWRAGEIDGRKR